MLLFHKFLYCMHTSPCPVWWHRFRYQLHIRNPIAWIIFFQWRNRTHKVFWNKININSGHISSSHTSSSNSFITFRRLLSGVLGNCESELNSVIVCGSRVRSSSVTLTGAHLICCRSSCRLASNVISRFLVLGRRIEKTSESHRFDSISWTMVTLRNMRITWDSSGSQKQKGA
jgi:hypothetical protein